MNWQTSPISKHPQTIGQVGRRFRFAGLGFAGIPLAGAFALNWNEHLPRLTCPILYFTGIPCPTCGMTRSFMAIARGDIEQAISFHLLGPVVFLVFLILFFHVLLELATNRRIHTAYTSFLSRYFHRYYGVGFMFLTLFLYHGYRLYMLSKSGALISDFTTSPLGQLQL